MEPIQKLEAKVKDLYSAKDPNREWWADWLAQYHVFLVADNATKLAQRFGGNEALARAAALLHDIADVKMSRKLVNHSSESLQMARVLMKEAGFSDEDITLVVDDAIRFHSCHGTERPVSIEGKILATADSMAHLGTDFYIHGTWAFGKDGRTLEQVKQWVLEKIERDLNVKMFFDEIRQELLPDYDRLKVLFSK